MGDVDPVQRLVIEVNVHRESTVFAHPYALNCQQLAIRQVNSRAVDKQPTENELIRLRRYRKAER